MWEDDSDKHERLANSVNKLLGDISVRRKLLRFLYLCAGVNVLIWAASAFFPLGIRDSFERVHEVSDKLSKIILAMPFALGMAITYSGFRLKFPDIEEQNLDFGVMASYAYQTHSQRRWLVWLFSAVGGVLNLLFLVILVIYLNSED